LYIVASLCVLTTHVTVCECHAKLKGHLLTYLITLTHRWCIVLQTGWAEVTRYDHSISTRYIFISYDDAPPDSRRRCRCSERRVS